MPTKMPSELPAETQADTPSERTPSERTPSELTAEQRSDAGHHQDAIYLGNTVRRQPQGTVEGDYVELLGETYYRIRHADLLPPFFMSIVSSADHWLFVASNGGLSAGRVDADRALFPYETHDKLIDNSETTGPKTILRVERDGRTYLWEPFSRDAAGLYRSERNLYKNLGGNKLVFEEVNDDLGLVVRYAWRSSDRYGFVKTSWLANIGQHACTVQLLDGLQNLLPYGATATLQTTLSNLLDAYKRNELDAESGLGLFALSATLSDLAEPSESLRATTVWQQGLTPTAHALTSEQLEAFRCGRPLRPETDMRGRRGAYFVSAALTLAPGEERSWHLVADVARDHAQVVALRNELQRHRSSPGADLAERLERDIQRGDEALATIIARADGQQWTADRPVTAHHLASVLFNVMRGGYFPHDEVERSDLLDFVRERNRAVLRSQQAFFDALPEALPYRELVAAAAASGSHALERLCRSYLPLAFSRRHGDPSRPWNRFAIHVRHPDGRPRLDYQGNWRDIFQNWEALAYAFPDYVEGMICTFLSATTADGYNPYRLSRAGVDWEVPEPENPWANIGYWSDHQIIYLQKLLEVSAAFHPGDLEALLSRRIFSHADVPYRIRPYRELLENPYDSIVFDRERHQMIEARVRSEGSDAKLLRGPDGQIFHVTMAEKLLLLLLVKLANLVPEGGLWMNTQRPEWNDANNALVGKGLSVVTIAYLVRYVAFLRQLMGRAGSAALELTTEVAAFLDAVDDGLQRYQDGLGGGFSDAERRAVMDVLGEAGSDYRTALYQGGFSGQRTHRDAAALERFLARAQAWLEHTLRANRRDDALYHAYNLLRLDDGRAAVEPLYEMLEGQVAALSSGLLSAEASLELLRALRHSRLYRADQHSYLLYPDRELPGFLSKNRIPAEAVRDSALVAKLLELGDVTLIVRDEDGGLHFGGDLTNGRSVRRVLDELRQRPELADLVAAEGERLVALFEQVFDHASFTGRSGTFFAYEGLGSIYWHMVSKLLLAVQETWRRAVREGAAAELRDGLAAAYYDIRAGLGFAKSPQAYGAFPTDPYSHTPAHAGAQQPGMTGQVKEDILARLGELGVVVADGRLGFAPGLLRREEFFDAPTPVTARSVHGEEALRLEPHSLAFTICQVPVVYRLDAGPAQILVSRSDGSTVVVEGMTLDPATSREIFTRSGSVRRLDVAVPAEALCSPARQGAPPNA